MMFFAHDSHESSLIFALRFNGDLFGRTNLTNSIFSAALGNMSKLYCAHLHENSMILFVKIRATEKVAIKFIENVSCRFVRFVGKKK